LRCEFCDATTENEFLRHHLAMTQGQLRVTFLFCALFYLCFAATDLIWVGYSLTTCLLVGARMAVAAVVLTCLVLLKRRPDSIPFTRVAASIVEWPARLPADRGAAATEFSLHAISMSIVIIVLYIYIPNRLLYAAGIAAAPPPASCCWPGG
jgi:hypothetical protein